MKKPLLALCLLACVAAPAYAARDAEPQWRYTIRPGDTLIGFSQRYLAYPAAWPRVQTMNHIADPYRLQPGGSLNVPLSMLRRSPAPARVTAVSGKVVFTPGLGLAHALQVGDTLPAGSRLDSAADSSASLRFADGTVLVLQPESTLHMDTVSVYAGGGMADTRLRLQAGRVEIGANPAHVPGTRLQITTPSAVAAVRGTEFRVGTDAATTQQETLAGRVGLAAAKREVMVAAGMGAVAEAGHAPSPPVALLPTPELSGLPARIDTLPLRFVWPALASATHWLMQIAPDAGFNRVLLQKTGAEPRASFADLPDGQYVLRVRGIDAHGLQGRDALHAFTLDARPFAPLLIFPAQSGVVRSATPELRWSEAVGEDGKSIANYRVELAHDAAFSHVVQADTLAKTSLAPAHELTPGAYWWRVASIVGDDQGPYTPPVAFTYKPAPGAPDLAQSAVLFDGQQMRVSLPPPADGLHYEARLLNAAADQDSLWAGSSSDGKLVLPRPATGKRYLAVRMVEADGTAGPFATQALDVPRQLHWAWLLLLIPPLFAL
jgi:hypothetical protein